MADVPVFPVEDPVFAAVCARLEQSIRIKHATPHYQLWVIVRLGHGFELCDLEGHMFDWYLNLWQVFLMCLREQFLLCYQPLFWLQYQKGHQGDLYTVTYRFLVPKSWVSLFRVYFPRAGPICVDTSIHLVASSVHTGIRYLGFDDIYESEKFNGWWLTPSTSANLDHLAISFDKTTSSGPEQLK